MIKKLFVFVVLFFFGILTVNAQRGCCSHHGGVYGCSSSGRQVCNDGTLSKSCTCTPPKIYGCTDSSADNYNKDANTNDGSCIYKGCMDINAINYNKKANSSNGTCLYKKETSELNDIPFKIIKEKDCSISKDKIIKLGQNGKKEVNYSIIQDETGKQISKTITTENIITNPINQVVKIPDINCKTDEENNSIFLVLLLLGLFIFNVFYSKKFYFENLIINKIRNSNKKILYIIYLLLIIPMIIDLIFILKIKFNIK